MNNLDKQYTDLLQDILDNGVTKKTRNGGTLSVFGRQIRHKMSDGFPLLTTKKMPFKTITTELLWFLRGDTNIKFLVDNNCHIWDGDAYKNYTKTNVVKNDDGSETHISPAGHYNQMTKEEFINKIKTDAEFAKKWGDLGPVYGKQWRSWKHMGPKPQQEMLDENTNWPWKITEIDQIQNLISDLKTNPDSRRLMVSAWNVGELDSMTLPPCHYGFQVYTRELTFNERCEYAINEGWMSPFGALDFPETHYALDSTNTPKRAISLMWNQRSVDTFLGLPFNIASYGLLLEIIAKSVNMVPDELIGNLGDTHLYLNHIEQAKEQIGRELSLEERLNLGTVDIDMDIDEAIKRDDRSIIKKYLDYTNIPIRTREPFSLPTLNINTEFWPYEGGECGEGPLDAVAIFKGFTNEHFCRCLLAEDIQLSNYQSHPTIKAPLSN